MTETAQLIERLRPVGQKIVGWTEDAARLRESHELGETPEQTAARLLEVEETAGAIYREIEEFDVLLAEISTVSPEAAAELADINSRLRLVLMEITELGTGMYAQIGEENAAQPASA